MPTTGQSTKQVQLAFFHWLVLKFFQTISMSHSGSSGVSAQLAFFLVAFFALQEPLHPPPPFSPNSFLLCFEEFHFFSKFHFFCFEESASQCSTNAPSPPPPQRVASRCLPANPQATPGCSRPSPAASTSRCRAAAPGHPTGRALGSSGGVPHFRRSAGDPVWCGEGREASNQDCF